ncbi:MAG TPA: YbhB/YbcL family Raf kinase inhibitor-like protein [Acidimicrobiales bacterium]|nr:YbhB/YbcL family Raf kinase inhibitor-like protein [Acidimicrobiales bacterium]
MPTPGSHRYDVRRSRLRAELDDQGVNDQKADEAANAILQRGNDTVSPAARTDRAAGPYGEAGGGGDPGAVIDLRSPAFNDHTLMPGRLSLDGGNASPPLDWSEPPEGTAELALLCEDPDAPGGTFLHWLLTGIDPSRRSLGEGEQPPEASSWENDYGERGYGGPRPPVGDDAHRYFFRLFALEAPLDLPAGEDREDVRAALEGSRLATGTLVGLFAR